MFYKSFFKSGNIFFFSKSHEDNSDTWEVGTSYNLYELLNRHNVYVAQLGHLAAVHIWDEMNNDREKWCWFDLEEQSVKFLRFFFFFFGTGGCSFSFISSRVGSIYCMYK